MGGGLASDINMHPLPCGRRWVLEWPVRVTALYWTQKYSCCYRVSARSVSSRPATPGNGRGGTGMALPAAGSSGSTDTIAGSLCAAADQDYGPRGSYVLCSEYPEMSCFCRHASRVSHMQIVHRSRLRASMGHLSATDLQWKPNRIQSCL